MMLTVLALPAGFLIDLIAGDPPGMPHPVVLMGKLIDTLEKALRAVFRKRLRGSGWRGFFCGFSPPRFLSRRRR